MAIDPNIKQKAENIRLKKKGREVRESLAAGLESMSEDVVETVDRQDYVEQQLQAVHDSTRGKDVISATEILASQVGADGTKYNNMKERLDAEQKKVNAQLAQIATITPESFGAKGDGLSDDRQAIQNSIDYLHEKGGGNLRLDSNKVYLISTVPISKVLLYLKDGVNIIGTGTIKVANGLGDYSAVFKPSTALNNVVYVDFTVDENTRNNPISINTGENGTERSTFSMWNTSMKNVRIDNITMKDVVGIWQYTSGGANYEDITIQNCTIEYATTGSIPTYDRTSIYFGVKGGTLKNNKLIGSPLANTAIELHGSNIDCFKNTVTDYISFMFIQNDDESVDEIDNINVHDNKVSSNVGILLWFDYDDVPIGTVNIHDNNLNTSRRAFGMHGVTGKTTVSSISFKNNTINHNHLAEDINFGCIDFISIATNKVILFDSIEISDNSFKGKFRRLFHIETQNVTSLRINNMLISNNTFTGIQHDSSLVFKYADAFSNVLFIDNDFYLSELPENLFAVFGTPHTDKTKELGWFNNRFHVKKPISINTGDIPINISQPVSKINLPTQKRNLKCLPGSIFYTPMGEKSYLFDTIWVDEIKTRNEPKHVYLEKGTIVYLIGGTGDNMGWNVSKTGYLPDHNISAGSHKKNDWVSMGEEVFVCVTDNSRTDSTYNADFTFLGGLGKLRSF